MTLITISLLLGRKKTGVRQSPLSPFSDMTIGDIPFIVQADPLYVDIAFLGAHDANTGRAERGAPLEPAASKTLRDLYPLLTRCVYRYSKTQTVPIYDLLRCGCRFLHIKVTRCDGKWFTSHSILTGELSVHVRDILRFLAEPNRRGEIVSLLFQPIYLDDRSLADLHDYLAGITYDGKNIFDYVRYGAVSAFGAGPGVRIADLRYNDITAEGTENGIVLFERRDYHALPSWDARESSYPYFFDMDSNALHVWHDHADPRLLRKKIAALVKKINATDRYSDMLRINQTQASSTVKTLPDFLTFLLRPSLLKIAENHNVKLIDSPDFEVMLRAMPVFQVDYLTSGYKNFNRRVNEKIRLFNENLVRSLRSQK